MSNAVAPTMIDTQKVLAKFTFKNKFGNPAKIQGLPLFTVDVQGVVSVFPADDGSSAEFTAIAPGTAVVTMTVISLGGVKITITVTVTITGDPAENEVTDIGVTFDPPVAQ